jgi:hypothetical protein
MSGFPLRLEKKTTGNAANVNVFVRFEKIECRWQGKLHLFKGEILWDIQDTACFSRIDSIGNRITAVCAGYAVQSTGEWHYYFNMNIENNTQDSVISIPYASKW